MNVSELDADLREVLQPFPKDRRPILVNGSWLLAWLYPDGEILLATDEERAGYEAIR